MMVNKKCTGGHIVGVRSKVEGLAPILSLVKLLSWPSTHYCRYYISCKHDIHTLSINKDLTLEEMLSLAALISASTENGTISETHQAAQCSHSAV